MFVVHRWTKSTQCRSVSLCRLFDCRFWSGSSVGNDYEEQRHSEWSDVCIRCASHLLSVLEISMERLCAVKTCILDHSRPCHRRWICVAAIPGLDRVLSRSGGQFGKILVPEQCSVHFHFCSVTLLVCVCLHLRPHRSNRCRRGVGLFRYWTISNLPLFFLAAPTLGVLLSSGVDGMVRSVYFRESMDAYYLAAPQLILALLAITTYHVQIITRIASGYPWWYIWLASKQPQSTKGVIRWMVLYALIQGGLYASFLPPA